jgi:predicted acylesterase/phospholipase RssA
MNEANRDGTAVILSGGGAYGAYEAGVLQALCQGAASVTGYQPLNAGIFTGTSVGAFNAAFMAMEPGAESAATAARLAQLWLNEISDSPQNCGNGVFRFRGNPLRYLETECLRNPLTPFVELGGDAAFLAQYLWERGASFLRSPSNLPQRTLGLIDLSALIDLEPFRALIRRAIRFPDLRRSATRLQLAATNWTTGRVQLFENADLSDEFGAQIIQASAAIPGIFPPVEIAGEVYLDGGVVMNTPLKSAIEAGATMLHVIYLNPDISRIPFERLQNSLGAFIRMFMIMQATITNEDIDHAAEINAGLDLLERAAQATTLTEDELGAFLRVAAKFERQFRQGRPYRKLTVHRYLPPEELGGVIGMLDFEQQVIRRSMERGFADAVAHDCALNGCLVPR